MKVSNYINELLHEHDCVILPGFGGFVGHYAPAKIHPISHTFHPPSKNILFNSKLTRDDGLLLDFIGQQEGITYQEARQKVQHYVIEIKSDLEHKRKVLLHNIGILKIDKEDRILFEPDASTNYLEESFGLLGFVSPPINRTKRQRRNEMLFIDRKPLNHKEKKRRKLLVPLLATIPIFLLIGWFLVSQQGLNIVGSQKTGIVTLPPSINEDITSNHNQKMDLKETTVLKDLDFSEEAVNKSLESDETTEFSKPEPTPAIIQAKPLYYIIGGAFAEPANAEKLVSILRQKGYNAKQAGLSKSGLHMVQYMATEDKSEALINLEMIRRDDNPSAWLLKK